MVPTVAAAAAQPAAAVVPSSSAARFASALRGHGPAAAPSALASPPAAAAAPGPRALAMSVERARQRLDAVLAQARQGRNFTAQELLVLQADAYRFSQTLEVAARVVEHGTQSVKQAVNTQV